MVDETGSDPSRVEPTQLEPTPGEPLPAEPTPGESFQAKPTPAEPTPTPASLSPAGLSVGEQSPADLSASGQSDPTCQLCGRVGSSGDLMHWVLDRKASRLSWTCPSCAAANIRSLEAKLDPEWW